MTDGQFERVMIFIDGSNLYHALKEKCGKTKVDFGHLVEALVGASRRLVRVYYMSAHK